MVFGPARSRDPASPRIPERTTVPGDQAPDRRIGDSGPEPFQYLALYEVEGDPEEILARFEEARIAGRITSSPALDPVFSGNFYEAVGEKVVKR